MARLPLILALALASFGCEALMQTDDAPAPPEDPPADELEAALRERGRNVAPYMILEGDAMRGELESGGARDFSNVLHPGWCYKLIGLGDESVTDLDLRVYDPSGMLLQRDTTQDRQPYIGQMRPICPYVSGAFRFEVRMVGGEGAFVAQLYRSI